MKRVLLVLSLLGLAGCAETDPYSRYAVGMSLMNFGNNFNSALYQQRQQDQADRNEYNQRMNSIYQKEIVNQLWDLNHQ